MVTVRMPLLVLLGVGAANAAEVATDFHRHIKPILEASCIRCHGADRAEDNVRFETWERMSEYVVPGKPDESTFYETLVLPDHDRRAMPIRDRDRLSDGQIAHVRRWIADGAPWPDGEVLTRVEKVLFSSMITLLQTNCTTCHHAGDAEGGLRLDDRSQALRGGVNGPAWVPYDAKASRIHRVLVEEVKPHHRPKFLDPQDIALLATWIDQGGVWPADVATLAVPRRAAKTP
jgi:mono/diheme cytochrome c family protein